MRQIYEDRAVYTFDTVAQPGELPEYEITWIPEGFELVEEYGDEDLAGEVYYNESKEYYIGIEYNYICGATLEEVLFEGEAQSEKVTVNGMEADYYYDETSNVLVWIDKNDNVSFTINAQLSKEEIIRIAESIIKK